MCSPVYEDLVDYEFPTLDIITLKWNWNNSQNRFFSRRIQHWGSLTKKKANVIIGFLCRNENNMFVKKCEEEETERLFV